VRVLVVLQYVNIAAIAIPLTGLLAQVEQTVLAIASAVKPTPVFTEADGVPVVRVYQ
jgi:hypothetical protein